ncbi:conserved domain protein [Salmonella enterica subsp. enterica]|uniref:Conserved domain protein n=1 Tax=Salmonella enterica I TaxID=59201 RepID=A0A379WUK5_SALET|nr:conserved domain protein [Salmonella enterica subsp. enterica]
MNKIQRCRNLLAGKTRTVRINNENEYCHAVSAASFIVVGCTPRIEVAAPEQPITINMNVKIEHEIHIKVDKDVEELLKSRSDLF